MFPSKNALAQDGQSDILRRNLLDDLLNASPDHIYFKDLASRFIKINGAMARLFGLKNPCEAIGRTDADFFTEEHAKATLEDEKRVMRTGEPLIGKEERETWPDGRVTWVSTSKSAMRDGAGNIIGMVGISRDITERKRMEQLLQESEALFRTISEASPLGIILTDENANTIYANVAQQRLCDRTAEELAGTSWRDAIHPKDRARVIQEWEEIKKTKRHFRSERRYVHKDGKIVWVSLVGAPILRNDGGEGEESVVRGYVGMVEDITEHKEAERNLLLSEERMELAMELLEAGEWELNLEDHTTHHSLRHDRIFGYDTLLPEWTYEIFLEHVIPEDRARVDVDFRAALAAHGDWNFECQIRRRDGVTRWIHAAGRHYPSESGKMNRLVGFVRDVTARRQAEEERRKIETKLLETQKLESLGVLAGGIAHDFNNLLMGVIGYTSLARAEIPDNSPLVHCLEQIDASSMRAADLCKQMLAYAGKGRFDLQNINLTDLVVETTRLLQISVDKDVTLKFDLASGLPATYADATQLRQIVMNLVINASEAIGKKGGVISITTGSLHADASYLADTLPARELTEGDYVYLEISDTGCGMPPETLAKIFDPFFTTKFAGRGLGLAAVLGIVRSHKGSLKVSSEPGKGTTFNVLLPCAKEGATPQKAAANEVEAWRGSGTVLVVDDEPIVRKTAMKMLESMGFRAIAAKDGQEAIELYGGQAEKIRAVLLDLTMPRMDGERTLRELRLLRPNVPVLLMSGFNEHETTRQFVGKGLAGFLQKPFKFENLRARMKEMLG
jgi:PAS domain S-box-containing protein